MPPKRKCWQSEDYRMGIFDAAAVGVAYFVRRKWAKCIIWQTFLRLKKDDRMD